MLTSSLLIGLAGIILMVTLMATEWYIWEPRYRGVQVSGPGPTYRLIADRKDKIAPRASAVGERVAPFAPQPVPGKILADQVQGGLMDHCSLS